MCANALCAIDGTRYLCDDVVAVRSNPRTRSIDDDDEFEEHTQQRDYFEDEEEKRRSASRPRHKSERERDFRTKKRKLFSLSLEDVLLQERHTTRGKFDSTQHRRLENEEKREKKRNTFFRVRFDDEYRAYLQKRRRHQTSPTTPWSSSSPREDAKRRWEKHRPSVRPSVCLCCLLCSLVCRIESVVGATHSMMTFFSPLL